MSGLREATERLTEAQAEFITVRLEWRQASRDLRRKRAVRIFNGHYSEDRLERDAQLRVVLENEYHALAVAENALIFANAAKERAEVEWQARMALETGQDMRAVA